MAIIDDTAGFIWTLHAMKPHLLHSLLDFGQKKRKRSRWSSETPDQKTVIPGMPTVIPPGLTRDQERAYIGEYLNLLLLCVSESNYLLSCRTLCLRIWDGVYCQHTDNSLFLSQKCFALFPHSLHITCRM